MLRWKDNSMLLTIQFFYTLRFGYVQRHSCPDRIASVAVNQLASGVRRAILNEPT